MPLIRPPDEWPQLLCGPMLRRVTPRSVSVFVALKEAHEVWLDIHLMPDPGSSIVCPLPGHGVTWTPTLALGERLHVLCLTLTLPGAVSSLDSDWIYGYNLKFRRSPGAQALSLAEIDGNLLAGDYPLGYAPGLLPSFCLPPAELSKLNVVHGSCRKPHGEGRDMLAVLDDFIAQEHEHFHLRPHQLFLTGDQIYADDVNLCLLRTLTETGKALLGWDEAMPNADGAHAFSLGDDWDGNWPRGGPRRETFVGPEGAVGYTSDYRDGHLMFLAEFCAMYLMAWSDALWPREPVDASAPAHLPGTLTLPTVDQSIRVVDWVGVVPVARIEDEVKQKVAAGREAALVYASSLPKVRRALANVPTYMMFDDHEVTDDWNLNWAWVRQVRSRAAGRRLLRNGMLAYAVFQDWGNNRPGDYASGGHGALLLDRLKYTPTQLPAVHQNPEDDALFRVLDLTPIPLDMPAHVYQAHHLPDPATRKRWDYVVDGPQHRVIVLDSRTWRAFPVALPGKPENGAPALIAHHILPLQLQRHANPDRLHIVVAPAPVIGIPVVEDVAQRILAGVTSPEAADLEAWGADRETFELLLAHLAELGTAILLSGDVHYAFSNHMAYFREPAGARARFVQLCASALKNEDAKTRGIGLIGHRVTPDEPVGWLGFEGDLLALRAPARKGFSNPEWWEYASLASPFGLAVREAKRYGRRAYFNLVLGERFLAPAVIPSGGWKTDALFQAVQGVAANIRWRYRITYLRDARPNLESTREKQPTQFLIKHIFKPTRAVVGFNNLGRISFAPDAPGQPVDSVIHRLYWYVHHRAVRKQDADLLNELWFTEHIAPLTPPDDSERPEVAR
jgi:hypothetical protein